MTNKFTTIKDRVLYLAEIKGIGKKKLCENIGMTYSNFTGKAKETPLNSTAIGNILTMIPDVNPFWLILGSGEIFQSQTTENGTLYDYLREKDQKIEKLLQENIQLKMELEKTKKSSTAASTSDKKHVG